MSEPQDRPPTRYRVTVTVEVEDFSFPAALSQARALILSDAPAVRWTIEAVQ